VTSEALRVLELFARPETPKASIIATSIALKLLAVLFFASCGWAVGLELPLTVYFLVVPASVLAAMLPVTLNGLGIREGTMVALLVLFGAPPADAGAMVLLALAVSMGFSAIGGLLYPFYSATSGDAGR
jgi:hypothetical protein